MNSTLTPLGPWGPSPRGLSSGSWSCDACLTGEMASGPPSEPSPSHSGAGPSGPAPDLDPDDYFVLGLEVAWVVFLVAVVAGSVLALWWVISLMRSLLAG